MLKVAVVTPYYKESDDILRQCHESVLRQSYPCMHILVADGHPKALFYGHPKTMHVTLPQANGDQGNTPRTVGGILAEAYGFDAVAYLDADNCPAFSLLHAWLMPKVLGPIADRIFLQKTVHERFWRFASDSRTVAFRTRYAGHYQAAGVPVPVEAKPSNLLSDEIVKYLYSIEGTIELTNRLGFYPRMV
jgi:hypothetical protein